MEVKKIKMSVIQNSDSILKSVKLQIGENPLFTEFDVQIISAINSAFFVLFQLGVGPCDPYKITNSDNVWSEFTSNSADLEMAKTYVPLKTRIVFDPPSSGILKQALEDSIKEMEFRLRMQTEIFRNLGGE